MSRLPRFEYPGAVYHVSSRGRHRQAIYLSDEDRDRFLDLLSLSVDKYGVLIHAYCLMGNHYHLLVETPRGNLSLIMQYINGSYSRHFKKKYSPLTSLFGGPYSAVLINTEAYLVETARYIVLNPVRAGIVRRPEEFAWSSYPATAGLKPETKWLTTSRILDTFGTDPTFHRERYVKFVTEGSSRGRELIFYGGFNP